MRVGSLFSGIGGIELGLERAGGFETAWFVEWEPYAQEVIKRHWPGVPVFGDIQTIAWESMPPVDVLTGGFPCQDISVSNPRGAGIAGKKSGLWKCYLEAIRVLRPRYIIAENSANLPNKGLNVVLADLAALGYDAEWRTLRASALGAQHERARTYLVAYPNRAGCRPTGARQDVLFAVPAAQQADNLAAAGARLGRQWTTKPGMGRVAHGVPRRVDRLRCLGNAVVPQVAQYVGEVIQHDANVPRTTQEQGWRPQERTVEQEEPLQEQG